MWLHPLPAWVTGLFAEIALEHRLLGWTIVLAFLVACGTLVILWARSWLPSGTEEPVEVLSLEEYRKLLEAGVLDPQEFQRIRARLDPEAKPPEVHQGIQDPQLFTGIRRPPAGPPPTSDPTT